MTENIDNEFIEVRSNFIVLNRDDVIITAIYVLGLLLGWYIGKRWDHAR